ncbi:TonB-dependent receptor, partial [Phenylobacterium hankyongense]
VDWFDIKLDGAIAQLGGGLQNTLNLCYNVIQDPNSEFCQAIARNPVTGEIAPPYYATITNANTGGLKTSGVDFEARYSRDLAWAVPYLGGEDSTIGVSTYWTW